MAVATEPRFTPEMIRTNIDFVEQNFPDLWRMCYPRIYREPACGEYYTPKHLATQLVGVAIKVAEGMIGKSERFELMGAAELVKYRVPMFWLSRDIATAIRQTTPPGDIPWYDMHLPFESGAFMMPKGAIVHPTDGDVPFIAWTRLRAHQEHRSPLFPGMPYGSTEGGMIFYALTLSGGYLLHWNLPLAAYGPTIQIPDLDSLVTRYTKGDDNHQSGVWLLPQPEMNEHDYRLMVEVVHYCFGAFLLMQNRPDLITHGALQKRVAKRGETREFWTPNVLGENYRIRREAEYQGGHHASPRMHWVRGFYREQPYGPKLTLRKQVWIEPFLRGVGE